MELILIAVLALVVLGGVDRKLHPQPSQRRPPVTRRAPVRRKSAASLLFGRQARPSHRVAASQVRPFLSLGPAIRR